MKVLNKVILIKTWSLESTGAAPGPLHPYQTRPDMASDAPIHLFFSIRAKTNRFTLIRANSNRNKSWNSRYGPIQAKTAVESDWYGLIPTDTAAERSQNGPLVAILLLHVALWEREREEKKKMRRHKEMVRT